MTTEIIFDGQYLRYKDQNGIERKIPAISGRPGYINPSTENVQLRDVGPIPEGTYNFGEQQSIDPVDSVIGITSSIIRNIGSRAGLDIKFGEWPGGSIAWGNERVWLHPEESTETFGRTNFSIHGGDEPGSAGCIDLMHNKEFFDFFRSQGDNVRLVVNYSNYDGSHNPLVSQYLDNQWQIQLPYVQSQIDQAISDGAYDQLQRQELISYYERVFKTYVRDRAGFNDMTIERGNDGNINARITGGNLLDHIANQNSNLASLIIHSAGGGGNDSNSQSISSIHITDENNNNITYQVRPGDHVNNLINSNIIDQHTTLNSHYLNNDQDNDCLFTVTSNNQTHTVVQDNINVTLIDGTIVPISSLIDMHLEANAALVDYNTSDYSFILDSLKDPQLISGWMIEIANGVAAHQSVEEIAKIIAIRTIVNQAAHKVSNATLNLYFTDEERQIANYAFSNNQTIDQAVSNMGSDEVSQETANKIALLEQSTGFQIAYGAVKAFAVAALIHHDDGLDRQEYGQLAVQAVATTAANTFVTDYFAQQGSGAAGAGAAAFVVAMVSAGVNDMFADDHMDSRQWQNTAVNAAALGAATAAGYAIGVAVAETYFITAGAAVGGPVGAAVAGMILALSGGLIGGPEYGPGEYPAPYDFLRIVPKVDGSGNEIYGLVREGVVAIASEYGDDDIYGTPGQDILIGKEGKNIVFGYNGSDHIEGRGNEDKLFGGNDNDDISGGSGNDYIAGGDGDDVISGDEGDDQILAGNGNDLVKAGQGDDQIEAEDGDDIVYGGSGNDAVLGGRGNDIIFGDEGDDIIYGEDGDDLLIGGDGSDIITGGDGNDNISGGVGNDNIRGDNGDDIIYGNLGNDTIHGDAGNDQIQGGQGGDLIFGGIGNDIISGGLDNDQILGEIGDDYLIGDEGDDVISGGRGNDIIYGGQGVDCLKGGDGDDLFLFRAGDGQDEIDDSDVGDNNVIKLVDINSNQIILSKNNQDLIIQFQDQQGNLTSDQITVKNQFNTDNSLNTVIDNIELADNQKILLSDIVLNSDNSITYQLINYDNQVSAGQLTVVENYQSLAIAESQITNPYSSFLEINYDTVDNANRIDNEHFNNVQQICERRRQSGIWGTGIGADGYDACHEHREPNLNGDNASNRIIGNSWGETIHGNNGNDDLIGNDGNDVIYGGNGNDLISGGNNNDRLFGEEGHDRIYGGGNEDYIEGNNGNDDIFGDNGDDQIFGLAGDDRVQGGDGHDNLHGGIGNDIIYGGSGNDSIFGDEDDDLIDGGDGNDYIEGGFGDDTIYGGYGNDDIHGQEGNDKIDGGEGDDQIWGGDGANIILGGAGNDMIYSLDNDDKIYGGDGNDIIWGGSGNNIIAGGNDNDAIYTGNGNDQINGGNGDDHIEAGDGNDIINGGAGDDVIYGQAGNDQIDGGDGNDQIITGNGFDNIEAGAGNDIVNSGDNNDIIDGGQGDDIINGGAGSDILIDDYGSNIFDLGFDEDADILNIAQITSESHAINTINNFDPIRDRIILKIDYQNPINFYNIWQSMVQNGSNTEINLANGQQIIFNNIDKSLINANNFTIALTDIPQNKMLFATNSNNIFLGENGNNNNENSDFVKMIYSAYYGNQSLKDFGLLNTGPDALYFGKNSNILKYQVDSIFFGDAKETIVDFTHYLIDGNIDSRNIANEHQLIHSCLANGNLFSIFSSGPIEDNFKPQLITDHTRYYSDDDVAFRHDVKEHSSYYTLENNTAEYWFTTLYQHYLTNHFNYAIKHYFTKNFYNTHDTIIDGYNRSFGSYDGSGGNNILIMTEGNDMLALEDKTSPIISDGPRVKNMSVIYAGGGDDLINFSSPNYSHGDINIYGGDGNDKIWSSIGNDHLFGQSGDDEIYGGSGDDKIDGGDGDDFISGGAGNNILTGGWGNDIFCFDSFENDDRELIYHNDNEIDVITDFIQNEDKIKITNPNFDHIIYAGDGENQNGDSTGLEYHFDESGNTIINDHFEFIIKLSGHIELNNGDFIFGA